MSCWHQMQDQDGINRQLPIINAYSESLSNLQVLADGYPSLEYVQSISAMRQTGYSMDDIGEGKNSDGPELIISVDDCPTWINLWGGANTVVQALWKVKNTRSEAEGFISKLSAEDTPDSDGYNILYCWYIYSVPAFILAKSRVIHYDNS